MSISWYCYQLKDVDESFLERSLNELSEVLKSNLAIDLITSRVSNCHTSIIGEKIEAIEKDTQKPFREFIDCLKCTYIKKYFPLLIYCQDGSLLADAARKECSMAIWGYTYPFEISAVYRRGNKYIIWHEALHLFDTDDCYDPKRPSNGTNCKLTNCLFQYEPTEKTVGNWPFICSENKRKIAKALKSR